MGTIIDEEATRKAVEAGCDTVMLKPDLREIARQVAIEGSYDGQNLVDRIEAALRAERERAAKIADAYAEQVAAARDRALAAGRTNVSSHRQSDFETASQIASAIRKGE